MLENASKMFKTANIPSKSFKIQLQSPQKSNLSKFEATKIEFSLSIRGFCFASPKKRKKLPLASTQNS